MSCSKLEDRRIVIVGKTGCGKSSTGNTLVGHKIFKTAPTCKSVTQLCDFATFEYCGKWVKLVDVPGFVDTEKSFEDLKNEITRCILLSAPGIHALLFTIMIGRYTEDDMKTMEQFRKCFGEEVKKYVFVVFTGKDNLEEDGISDEEWMEASSESLKSFIQEIDNRYVFVSNRGTTEEREQFRQDLMTKISQMIDDNGGTCYTNAIYKLAQERISKAEEEEFKMIMEKKKAEDEHMIRRATEDLRQKLENSQFSEQEKQKKFEDLQKQMVKEQHERHQREASENVYAFTKVGVLIGACFGPLGILVGAALGSAAGLAVEIATSDSN